MSFDRQGSLTAGQKVRTRKPRMTINDIGLVTLREDYSCNEADLFRLMPVRGQRHGTFPNLECKMVQPEFHRAGLAQWVAEYRGAQVSSGVNGGGQPLPPPIYEVIGTISSEPIRTAPSWAYIYSQIGDAGIILESGIFQGFDARNAQVQALRLEGVENYLAPGVIFRKRYLSKTKPSGLYVLGMIDEPDGKEPSAGDRNWLKIEFSYTEEADVFSVTEGWQLSGPNGWNTAVYAKSSQITQ